MYFDEPVNLKLTGQLRSAEPRSNWLVELNPLETYQSLGSLITDVWLNGACDAYTKR